MSDYERLRSRFTHDPAQPGISPVAANSANSWPGVPLLVTHRFSTVAAADLVVVIDHGRVSEVGTHAQLMVAGGHYAELYQLQARGYR